MDDVANVTTFMIIFAVLLVLYGAVLTATGNKELLPYRAMHSVRGPADVRRVGRITMIIGAILGVLMLICRLVFASS